ncbi:MAG: hypothetical protein IPM34_03305 [Saprospiraceae bacterium]|nr:hypothetical protein [Saprospiraceae bacterium]
MKAGKFYLWLVITAVSSFAISSILKRPEHPQNIMAAQIILVVFFILFTLSMFYIARIAIQSTNPYLFTRVFMVSVFFKIILLSLLVFSLVKLLVLVPKQLAVPLGVSYLLFTIYETWVLMKLSKGG